MDAEYAEAVVALEATILDLTGKAGRARNGSAAGGYASAIRDLAEAWAWLRCPDQAHGGSSSVTLGS